MESRKMTVRINRIKRELMRESVDCGWRRTIAKSVDWFLALCPLPLDLSHTSSSRFSNHIQGSSDFFIVSHASTRLYKETHAYPVSA